MSMAYNTSYRRGARKSYAGRSTPRRGYTRPRKTASQKRAEEQAFQRGIRAGARRSTGRRYTRRYNVGGYRRY